MGVKLNITRSFWVPINLRWRGDDDKWHTGQFRARFRVIPATDAQKEEYAEKRLLDVVLLEVADIELEDESGAALVGEALFAAAKDDPTISTTLVDAYWDSVAKKPTQKRS